jgi:FtsH-binding integral membrane protein
MTLVSSEQLSSTDQKKLQALRVFLRVYGALSLALFTSLLLGFIVQFQPLDLGRPMHWVIWDRVTDHVGPMLFVIYMVWSIYLIRAAADPLKYQTFLDFTMWANLAHGLLMVPYALTEPEYHSKFLTDIPWLLGSSAAIFLLRPSATASSR